jgi:alkylation response protein AidB-like acyl-CoA dehydrogenase
MDFDLNEEQRLLKESLDRLIGDRYAFEQRKSYGQSAEGWSRELWAQYAELGLLGLPFAEHYGRLRPCLGARAVSRDGGAWWRVSSSWRQRPTMR